MSQSRFSIVLVGVSALLRRPLVSRLRPADGERSPWVVFAARGCRFDSGGRWAGWPSGSLLPPFGTHRFGDCPRRVGLWAHCFRFSARTASEWLLGEFVLPPSVSELPFGGLAFGLTASAFRHAPLRSCPRRVGASAFRFGVCRSAGWASGSPLPLFGMHRFGVALGELVLPPSASGLPLGGLAFGLTASAFRHAPLRAHRSVGWFCRLPLRRLPLGGLAFGLTTSAFRHAPLRDCHSAGCLRVRSFRFSARTASELPSASWPSGSRLPLFGMHRSAPPCRRREGRRSAPTRHLFHFKTLIPTC